MATTRLATKGDIDLLFDMIRSLANHEGQLNSVLTKRENLLRDGFSDIPKFEVIIAQDNENVMGYISYTWRYSIWKAETFMQIDDVYVKSEYRGQNIGQKLMLKAQEICQSKGVSQIKWEVEQDNDRALKFYEGLGAESKVKVICTWN
ncbi:MAG: GNAT family N-acetyltransferase [Pseudobacteriovorax sp.]|nr:GNAT family N-acetyltransferase [Pseudobacteriovorax sp.]